MKYLKSTLLLLLLLVCNMVNAQTEVGSIAELKDIPEGTNVKLTLNNAHTVAYNYDFWEECGFLYLQDETGATVLQNFLLDEQKTINGFILATTVSSGGSICLKATEETNKDNISITDWKYEGQTTTIADILAGKHNNALVTINDVTTSSTGSEYSVNLSDGSNDILLYDEWDRIDISKIPEKCKSVTALVVTSVWTGEIYLIGISQDLIINANTPDDGSIAVKDFASLSDVKDGSKVLVELNDVHVSATYTHSSNQKFAFMEDATGGAAFIGFDALEANTTLNGSVYATVEKHGDAVWLDYDASMTNADSITTTVWTPVAHDILVNGALNKYWIYRLVRITNAYCTTDEYGNWVLTQDDHSITTDDELRVLEDLDAPEYIASFTGIVVCDEDNVHHILPISKDLIIAGEAPEPEDLNGVAAIRYMTDGEEFEIELDHAQVTWMEEVDSDGGETWSYIVEDKTGAVILEEFPFYDLQVGDYLTGTLYGIADIKDYKSVSCTPGEEAWGAYLSIDEGELQATKLTIEEAKKPRWQNCFVELNNCEWTTGSMLFYGETYEYPALYDGTATILFDDGWEVLGDNYQRPSHVDNITGHVVSLWGCSFIFPKGPESINSGIQQVDNDAINSNKVYNLAGQRLNKATKGINIINGKKVIK